MTTCDPGCLAARHRKHQTSNLDNSSSAYFVCKLCILATKSPTFMTNSSVKNVQHRAI